mgnify:CR=1 FL=1
MALIETPPGHDLTDTLVERVLAALGRAEDAVTAFESGQALGAWPGDVAGPLRRARCAAGRYADAIDGPRTSSSPIVCPSQGTKPSAPAGNSPEPFQI